MAEMFISVSELMHTVTLVVSVFFTPQRIITVNIFVFDVENPLLGLRIIVLRPVFDARVLAEIESFLLPPEHEDVMDLHIGRIETLGEVCKIVDVRIKHISEPLRRQFSHLIDGVARGRPGADLLIARLGYALLGNVIQAESVSDAVGDIHLADQLPVFDGRAIQRVLVGCEGRDQDTDHDDQPQKNPFADAQQRQRPVLPPALFIVRPLHVVLLCYRIREKPQDL